MKIMASVLNSLRSFLLVDVDLYIGSCSRVLFRLRVARLLDCPLCLFLAGCFKGLFGLLCSFKLLLFLLLFDCGLGFLLSDDISFQIVEFVSRYSVQLLFFLKLTLHEFEFILELNLLLLHGLFLFLKLLKVDFHLSHHLFLLLVFFSLGLLLFLKYLFFGNGTCVGILLQDF
jgi:hypothetical protein